MAKNICFNCCYDLIYIAKWKGIRVCIPCNNAFAENPLLELPPSLKEWVGTSGPIQEDDMVAAIKLAYENNFPGAVGLAAVNPRHMPKDTMSVVKTTRNRAR